MSEEQIHEIVDQVLALVRSRKLRFPSPPIVITRINQVLNSTGSSTADMVKLVQTHPVLAAKLLQVANSAALNRGVAITSLTDAIQRLGFSFVRNLALSLTLRDQFNPVSPLVHQVVNDVWDHSVHIGALSTLASQYLNIEQGLRTDGSIALLVGIIHSIGEIPLVDFALNYGYKPQTVMTLPEEAKRELSVGVLESWEVPEPIIHAINLEGYYGLILKFAHQFLSREGEENITTTKTSESESESASPLISFKDFAAFVEEHKDTITDLKATFG